MVPSPQLVEILLAEFQAALVLNLNTKWEAHCGQQPKYGYVEHTEHFETHRSG